MLMFVIMVLNGYSRPSDAEQEKKKEEGSSSKTHGGGTQHAK